MTSNINMRSLHPDSTQLAGRKSIDSPAVRGGLFLLTLSTGLVDAVSYLGMGHIFTANMTGNVVLLGFALAGVPGLSITRSLVSLGAFLVGATLGGQIAKRMADGKQNRWLGTAFLSEGILLLIATILSAGQVELRLEDSGAFYTLISVTAIAMGIRNATVRKLAVPDLTTTVLTLTVTGLAADSSLAGGTNPRWATRLTAVVSLFVGAAIGAFLLRGSVAIPLLASAAIASVCAAAMFLIQPEPALRGKGIGDPFEVDK